MKRARFRFYAELNDFLPTDSHGSDLTREFAVGSSVKDMIESFGVPHTEVEVVLVNGESVDFSHRVQDGDVVSVYPVFESFDMKDVIRIRPQPLRDPRFVLDAHLGTLARRLRLLGLDSVYRNDFSDPQLVEVSVSEGRLLLTRDVGILKHGAVTHGYFVRATDPRAQTLEVLRRFDLFSSLAPFRRCLRCNGVLNPVSKGEVRHRIPPRTIRYYDEFRMCSDCGRVYWKGSHYTRMRDFVEEVSTVGARSTG